ncbi:hypothetical protein Tco_0057804 [Tanacetum coccineum]
MVRFGNDHFVAIMGYGDLQMGNICISHVHYVEGLCHNLLFVRKFCDSNLEVAFRKHTCFVQNLEGYDEVFSNLSTLQILEDEILDLGKLQPKADIGIFIGYSPSKKAYQIYNKRTRQIMETMNVQFDELTQMASEQRGSGPDL